MDQEIGQFYIASMFRQWQIKTSRDTYVYVFQVYDPCSNNTIVQFRDQMEILHVLICMYTLLGPVIIVTEFNVQLNGSTYIKQLDRKGFALNELTEFSVQFGWHHYFADVQ